jgi:predicted Rossmann fold nucleotide-binding protein DprA/Smf involved in DNA uptake
MDADAENKDEWSRTCLSLDAHKYWAQRLFARLTKTAPSRLWLIGRPEILETRKIGLFCSVRCPGEVIPSAHRAARKLCEEDGTVISGFHSPVEKECLRICLEAKRSLIVCPARTLEKMRIPTSWKTALEAGRLLVLSRFDRSPRRVDTGSARRRNELVAALSDEVLIIHGEPGGQVEKVSQLVNSWGVPQRKLELRE